MQRGEVARAADRRQHVVVDDHRFGEPLAAVHHPVADPQQRQVAQVGEVTQDGAQHARVGRVGRRLRAGLAVPAGRHPRVGRPHPLDQAAQPAPPGLRVQDGELHRRAAAVQDQDGLGSAASTGHGPSQDRRADVGWPEGIATRVIFRARGGRWAARPAADPCLARHAPTAHATRRRSRPTTSPIPARDTWPPDSGDIPASGPLTPEVSE